MCGQGEKGEPILFKAGPHRGWSLYQGSSIPQVHSQTEVELVLIFHISNHTYKITFDTYTLSNINNVYDLIVAPVRQGFKKQ